MYKFTFKKIYFKKIVFYLVDLQSLKYFLFHKCNYINHWEQEKKVEPLIYKEPKNKG